MKKLNGIKLLKLIKKNKIKDGTKILCSDFPVSYYYQDGTLGFYDAKKHFIPLSLKDFLENINYSTYEIKKVK